MKIDIFDNKICVTLYSPKPKRKRVKPVYLYEAEAKALVGKYFIRRSIAAIGKVLSAEKDVKRKVWYVLFQGIDTVEQRGKLCLRDAQAYGSKTLLFPGDWDDLVEIRPDIYQSVRDEASTMAYIINKIIRKQIELYDTQNQIQKD